MPGMSFPAVNQGVKLCFQSQHYKWALLTDQIWLKAFHCGEGGAQPHERSMN